MRNFHNNLYLSIIFTTGFCSLGYQVIWQRYLSVLVGSHARSATIIISVFLLGLALGYYVFGRVSEKIKDRYLLLKIYGFTELATGVYAALFPSLFKFLLDSPLSHTNNFWMHLGFSGLLLIPVTFLMGATVPVMTTVLPESRQNVNLIHSRIYGLNTLGAFVGTLISGLYIIPKLGYDLSLFLLGALNVLVSLFYIKNGLSGPSYEKEKPQVLEHKFNQKLLYGLGFVAGFTCIALEVLWLRILGLTIGNSFIVFPFVLSIFILMIGLGSLTLRQISLKSFQNGLGLALIFSASTFLTVPYLPLFISHIRISLVNHWLAFYLYHSLVYLSLLVVLSPAIFYLGRLLPLVYAMIQKDSMDYGLKVGYLYFLNTLGTFLGAVGLGYLAFHFFDLKAVYLLSLSFLLILGLYFLWSRWMLQGLILVLALFVSLVPFSRKYHEVGLFRHRSVMGEHFKNIISQTNTPRADKKVGYLEDGPNATVAVSHQTSKDSPGADQNNKNRKKGEISPLKPMVVNGKPIVVSSKSMAIPKSIIVNGKSDGSSVGDYGTTTLLSLIPYMMTKGTQIKSMVIGIGTGISAGVLTSAQRVSQVDVVEISGAVIDSAPFMAPENFHFFESPKARIHKGDAFQFLKTVNDSYDIIVSEPPNPWVVGVENLYTHYFYDLARKQLTKDGVFVQWIHTYAMSPKILTTILSHLKSHFKNVTIFWTGLGDDIAFFSSNREEPFLLGAENVAWPASGGEASLGSPPRGSEASGESVPIEPGVRAILNNLHIERVSDLNFYKIYNSREVDVIIKTNSSFVHEIFHPTLNKEAYGAFYSGESVNTASLLSPLYRRVLNLKSHRNDKDYKSKSQKNRKKRLEEILKKASCDEKTKYLHFPCAFLVKKYKSALKNINSSVVRKRVQSYSILRDEGLIPKDISFIQKAMENLPPIEKKKAVLPVANMVVMELVKEGEFDLAKTWIHKLESEGFLTPDESQGIIKGLEQNIQKIREVREMMAASR